MSQFTTEWYEAHQSKGKKPRPNDRATKEKAAKLLREREALRIEANRKAIKKGPPKARKGVAKDIGGVERATVVIGIDPGVKTGMGIYRNGELAYVVTTTITQAIERVKKCHEASSVMVYVEDARMATYGRGGSDSLAKAQGAGSVKRDCKIWEDELTRLEIPHKMVRPNKQSNAIAANKKMWEKLTGYTKRNSEHARDAVMIARRFI